MPANKREVLREQQKASASASSSDPTAFSPGFNPLMENDWEILHGRADPGTDEINEVEGIPIESMIFDSRRKANALWSTKGESKNAVQYTTSHATYNVSKSNDCLLIALPSEIIDHIFTFLTPFDLTHVSNTCCLLSEHARSDLAWQRHVQDNVPGIRLASPAPCKTFRELYIAHDPHWFLPKYKIWFSDFYLTGKIIIVQYNPHRGCIEGHSLVAERYETTFASWGIDDQVVVHSFRPKCRLHLDSPVLQIDPSSRQVNRNVRFNADSQMPIVDPNRYAVYSNIILTQAVDPQSPLPLWPPPNIPSRERVLSSTSAALVGPEHKPQKKSEVSSQAFRIKRWFANSNPANPDNNLGEVVQTFSTLDPRLYTPTEDKPFRGIWVGDYSGHGCEFLLLNQPDDEEPFDEASVIQREDETTEEWEIRKIEERLYRGSIEAIKLTGDPNIPRGEYTFVADDISQAGFVRKATEPQFKGARIVKSRGHTAARMFRDAKYIESQLIIISPNRLAQYWLGFGHISFFERVDIDSLLTPTEIPNPPSETQK